MKKSKKTIVVVLAFLMLLISLCGCSKSNDSGESNNNPSIVSSSVPSLDDKTTRDEQSSFEEMSFGYLDYTLFEKYWTKGTFRCGTDFPEGEYYIMSLYGANAMYDVADNPNDFSWSHYRIIRRVFVKEGQYVNIPSGGLLVVSDEFDSNKLKNYGIFIVGKDLPAGDYKITTLSKKYESKLGNITGIKGAYQISNSSPENEPEECGVLFDDQKYISVEDGQFLVLNNVKLEFVGN